MLTTYSQNNIDLVIPDHRLILKYEGENELAFLVSGDNWDCLSVPKNRHVPKPLPDRSCTSVQTDLSPDRTGLFGPGPGRTGDACPGASGGFMGAGTGCLPARYPGKMPSGW